MVTNDIIMRQIEGLIKFFFRLIFNGELEEYREGSLEGNALHLKLLSLIEENNLSKGENLLFEGIDDFSDEKELISIGLDFYYRLNKLSNEDLKSADFSRAEIKNGLKDFLDEFGIGGIYE